MRRDAPHILAGFAGIAATLLVSEAAAQSVHENAVASATDAFGLSIGNERIGLYGVQDVRGFSPIDAGNGRIEGLYFAQLEALPIRIVDSTAVRVGITAQGYALGKRSSPIGSADMPSRTDGPSE